MVHHYALLSVSAAHEDHAALRNLLAGEPWLIHESHSLLSALMVLEDYRIPVLVCDTHLPSGTWKDLLERVALVSNPPCVIIGSRQADEDLWLRALRAGAFDVLAKPYNRSELLRTLADAVQHWRGQFEGALQVAAAG